MENRQERKDGKQMFGMIEDWSQSGKTQKEYCQERGLYLSVFGYWLRKYREQRESTGPSFVKLETFGSSMGLEIVYPNGVILRLPSGIDPQTLGQYLGL